MKEGWTYKKLGEIATFARGLTYSKNDEVESSDNIVLRSNNIDLISGKLDLTELKFLKTDFIIPEDKRLKRGSLFICISNGSKAHLGKVAYIDKDYNYAFGGFMGQITPNKDVAGQYLHYALCSPEYKRYIKSLSEGANINNLKYKDLELFTIPVPPLSEQQRIVERLDAAFAHIDELKEKAERQLSEARALFQRALTKAMEPKEGWEEKTLKEVSVISGDYGLSVPSKPFDGVRYLRITDITEWGDLNDDVVSAKLDGKKTQEELTDGDILFARTGATVGKTLVYKKEFGDCLFAGYLIRYRLNKEVILPRFMYYRTHSDEYYDWVQLNQEAAAQPNISAKKYNLLPVVYPPLSEQQRIVSRLDSLSENIRKYEEIQRKIVSECDALKQALLRKVFE